MKKKLAIVVSGIDKSLGFEWFLSKINKDKYELVLIVIHSSSSNLYNFALSNQIRAYLIPYKSKKDLLGAFIKVLKIFLANKFDIVHCHLFEGSFIGLLAGWITRIPNRIYTRHYSILHHNYYPKGVKYDLLINNLATKIIAISNNVKNTLIHLERVNVNKVHNVNHGFDLTLFKNPNVKPINELKIDKNLNDTTIIIGVIARYAIYKGIQFIIPAFKKFLERYPGAKLVLANAHGDYATEIVKLLKDLPSDSYEQILFEKDLVSLYQRFDIYVHVPIDTETEAFGQTYVEALAIGIPSIFTLSGIAPEFIRHNHNAIVVPFKDSESIFQAMCLLADNEELCKELVNRGRESVKEKFGIDQMIHNLEQIYDGNEGL